MSQKPYTICVLTGTRADYGLLRPLLLALLREPEQFAVRVVVTGTHLCAEYGSTVNEILQDAVPIDERIDILLSSDTPAGVTKSVGIAMISFADYFARRRPDLLIVLGDRFEAFACASAAALSQIPIAHLYGGDLTEGLIDEFIRHSITKMSLLHFVSNERSRQRVIQLGEAPERVWNVGALCIENALHTPFLSREALANDLKFALDRPFAVATFHPVTLEDATAEEQMQALLTALRRFPDLRVVFTKANADAGGRVINALLDKAVTENPAWLAVPSLGMRRYLSALKYATFVIGNSSSGLYEVPSFHIPTVNIGDRQRGRLHGESVMDCLPNVNSIVCAIETVCSKHFYEICQNTTNPFGDGTSSMQIIEILKKWCSDKHADCKKTFYDLGAIL